MSQTQLEENNRVGNRQTIFERLAVELGDEAKATEFSSDLAIAFKRGDVIALHGDLGSGKTTLVRGMIRALFRDNEMEVASPTFSLVHVYEHEHLGSIRHFDLYRLNAAGELAELGLGEGFGDGITLIEWPDIAEHELPDTACHLYLKESDGGEGRSLTIEASGELAKRLNRSLAIRRFLEQNWQAGVCRVPFPADASARSYEHVYAGGEHRILMNAPRLPDGPPIRDGKPYSQIAHLAEDVKPFIALAIELKGKGFAAPQIYAFAENDGLVLLEYLGDDLIITPDREPIEARYLASMDTLAVLHANHWPRQIVVGDAFTHTIPDYSRGALMIELELLLDWYIPHYGITKPTAKDRKEFTAIWDKLFARLATTGQSLVLRDYHSPNIIWREDEEGLARTGIIDFQDAMIGPSAYDVASIAQDARVNIPQQLEAAMLDRYAKLRKQQSTGFDEAGFREAYAIMAVQRVTKILGIFVRLDRRDGKSVYLAHLPRMRDYLARNLAHPVLKPYRDWLIKAGIRDI